ncbi:hypothetical protein LTR86_009751 [Recurvomyces mirabilis]|nr:hypothetical protein LTR86_009751 [Recurvomyces mirabilis]
MFETFRVEDPGRFSNASADENGDTRADSPMETRRSLSSTPSLARSAREGYITVADESLLGPAPVEARAQEQPPSRRTRPTRPPRSTSNSGDVRFVVINHPEQLHNRSELRLNRQHVMKDFLTKAAKDPNTKDIRVTNQVAGRKRPRVEVPITGISYNPVAPSRIFQVNGIAPDASSSGASNTAIRPPGSNSVLDQPPSSDQQAKAPRVTTATETAKTVSAPLVSGISGRFRNYAYLGTTPDEVPFPLHHINGSLNPFDTWPKLDDPKIRVNELKWSCSRRFGSRGIADHWVPMLLSARHAFLSTIVISSAHDDIMSRQSKHPDQRPKTESVARATVRHQVTTMVNECMKDPMLQTSDATLVAVLHLLNAGIMGCDDKDMRVHERGINAMVRQRGGLNALGVHGQLAMICTITMYIVASLRETTPDPLYIRFAAAQKTQIPKGPRNLPESPLYCRQTGYQTLTKVLKPESRIYKLLELCRQLTNAYCAQLHTTSTPPTPDESRKDEIAALTIDIFTSPRASALTFDHPHERHTYEAIRLTALIFSQALSNHVPFSTAAHQLQLSGGYTSLGTGTLSTEAPVVKDCLMHIHIRNALIRTDTADCWGHLAGVLFWISLVAGAAANPETGFWTGGYRERRVGDGGEEEEEEARKWLAAVVVRCEIVLGFEYGSGVLDTMKRMMRVQEGLAGRRGGSSGGGGRG